MIPENLGSADAMRAVADSLTADNVAVLSADVVSDVPLAAVLVHQTPPLVSAAPVCVNLSHRIVPNTYCFTSGVHTSHWLVMRAKKSLEIYRRRRNSARVLQPQLRDASGDYLI